jgi:hypothetical protein
MSAFLKAFAVLAGLAVLGTSSLLLTTGRTVDAVPPEVLAQAGGRSALTAALMLQPVILALLASAAGLVLARKLGLRSILVERVVGSDAEPNSSSLARTSIVVGTVAGMLIVVGDLVFTPWTGKALSEIRVAPGERLGALLMGLLYGGITEEIISRWGLLSIFAWMLVLLRVTKETALAAAVVVSASLFAVAHLPALAITTELNTALIARTLVLNTGAGILFGFAFVRHSLEAAMAAHAISHMVIFVARLAGVAY